MKSNLKITPFSLSTASIILLALSGSASATVHDIVGEVTTVIGIASLNPGASASEPVRRGAPVRAGDRIETAVGGHVHIRFIDGGMVSVRPKSSLHIEAYQSRSATSKGAIKFQLEQGVVRSVTGAWGEQSRDQFRLNTPVAAIGIKGTDFIVKSSASATQASVISGAIVMSPIDSGCLGSLGPCNLENSALLSADMSDKMLQIVRAGQPQLVPAIDLEARLASRNEYAKASLDNERASTKIDSAEENIEKTALHQNRVGQIVEGTLADNLATKPLAPVDTTPADAPLVWLRNILEWNVPPNSISKRFDMAEANARKAVAGSLFVTLYRDETTRTDFAPPVGSYAFKLAESSASFSRPGLSFQPVAVSDGKLNVDFGQATYTTSLALAGAFGQTQFDAAGKITSQGLIIDSNATQAIAGAFSFDGQQAGYQFEKNVANGKVSGITLWGR
ncbi:MAG: FecR family protein [Rhodocyclaceae bacterium]|nr:FecR family protein [Rhodocyclaceae bacterium]